MEKIGAFDLSAKELLEISVEPEIVWFPMSPGGRYALLKTPARIPNKSELLAGPDMNFKFKGFFLPDTKDGFIFLIMDFPVLRRTFIFRFFVPDPATREFFHKLISFQLIFFNDEPNSSSAISFEIRNISLFTDVLRSYNETLGSPYFILKAVEGQRPSNAQTITKPQRKRKWWQFGKKDSTDEPEVHLAGFLEESTAFKKSKRARDLSGKVKKCLDCGAEILTGGLECPACGSGRFIWE